MKLFLFLLMLLYSKIAYVSLVHYQDVSFVQMVNEAKYIVVAEFIEKANRKIDDKDHFFDVFKITEVIQNAKNNEDLKSGSHVNVWAAHAYEWGMSMANASKGRERHSPLIKKFKTEKPFDPSKVKQAVLFLNHINLERKDYSYYAEGGAISLSDKKKVLQEIEDSKIILYRETKSRLFFEKFSFKEKSTFVEVEFMVNDKKVRGKIHRSFVSELMISPQFPVKVFYSIYKDELTVFAVALNNENHDGEGGIRFSKEWLNSHSTHKSVPSKPGLMKKFFSTFMGIKN